MLLHGAAPAESLRATLKDDALCAKLVEQASAALAALAGSHEALRWQAEVRAAALLAYFGLTLGRGRPTPGDEYCDVTQVRAADGSPCALSCPSFSSFIPCPSSFTPYPPHSPFWGNEAKSIGVMLILPLA